MRNTTNNGSRPINVLLWTIQGLLGLTFLFAGGSKLILPIAVLTQQSHIPGTLLRFVGVLELLGAAGLVLPGLIHLRAELTPLAAAGLTAIMCAATSATLATGPAAPALVPIVVGLLLVFVGIGRWKVAPFAARTVSRPLPLRAAA
jgi:hypothetical protein